MAGYVISEVDIDGRKLEIITREHDEKAISMDVVNLFIDLAHEHPEIAQPMITMLVEMKATKEFRSAVQA